MQIFFSIRNLSGFSLLLAVLACLCSSCGNTRQLTLMQGQFDTARLSQIQVSDPVIQKGDLLSIIVYSDNPQATALYNQSLIIVNSNSGASGGSSSGGASGGSGGSGGGSGSTVGTQSAGSPTTPGYQVDESGNIQFQGLGTLHVEGLTKTRLIELLDSKLKDFLKNPYYTIRFLNYRFTMLGEVNHPGVYGIPGERISILEALGLAGDLTFYGRRDNVFFIRENNGKREFARLDLTKPEIMASPYFMLQQNDVVIVEANRKKVVASDQVTARNVTIAASIVSTLAILYSIFRK
ncbi:MAG TPA: polysaccharide biosynthesis/export family protein [Puia sp.]|jgi:polysaccharide export outer membrane protein|nr:polysaccharide biosynthesis/export family protein [Puia sp.]